MGLNVDVFMLGSDEAVEEQEQNLRMHSLPTPLGHGPRFFAAVHRRFREAAWTTPARVYHASDLYVLPAMSAAARRQGGRLAFDARELYTHVTATAGRPLVRHFWRAVEGHYIRRADAVFTVSTSISRHLANAYHVPPPTVLPNVPVFRHVVPAGQLRRKAGIAPESVLILHQGQMRASRGCELLVDAMRDVHGSALVFLGDGPQEQALRLFVAKHGLEDRVRFLPPVPPGDLLPLTADADIGVTLLEDTCLNHRYALPNKLFEYLMAGLPVLGSDLPEIRSVIAGFDVGCVVDPSDRQALVDNLQAMVADKSARRRWAANSPLVFERFDGDDAAAQFMATYRRLLG